MAIKKKVVKKETAKPSNKVSKKPTPKPMVPKVESSLMIIVKPNKEGMSIKVSLSGNKQIVIGGLLATAEKNADFADFIENLFLNYVTDRATKQKNKK